MADAAALGLFLGRKGQLAKLEHAWELARGGDPQLRVVVADSGYGKTKLVHALYGRLSKMHDPNDYWPPSLLTEESGLWVMPSMDGAGGKGPMPWLWFGVRWPDPGAHNRLHSRSRLLESFADPGIKGHLDGLTRHLEQRAIVKRLSLSLVKAFAGLAPGFSTFKELLEASLDVLDALAIRRDYRAMIAEGSEVEKRELKEAAAVLAIFATVLDRVGENDDGIPVVLFLDDAQWMDPMTVWIIGDLWHTANERGWKLLIVATHWEQEWALAPTKDGASFAAWYHGLTGTKQCGAAVLKVGKLSKKQLGELLAAWLPGLTEVQSRFFIERACGNPRYIVEIALFLRQQEPELFVDRDMKLALTPHGFERAQKVSTRVDELEASRFNAAADHVKMALGLSSLQGDRFVNQFTLDVAANLMQATGVTQRALAEAEDPFNLASKLDDARMRMEFRSRAILVRSDEYVRSILGKDVVEALSTTVKQWIASGQMATLQSSVMFDQVSVALDSSLAGGDAASVGALVSYLGERANVYHDFDRIEGVAEKLNGLLQIAIQHKDRSAFAASQLPLLLVLELLLEHRPSQAAKVYQDACRVRDGAEVIGHPEIEASASRLAVQALNEQGLHERALQVADHALHRPYGSDQLEHDRTLVQKGDALLALGQPREAAQAYLDAADSLESSPSRHGSHHQKALAGLAVAMLRSRSEHSDDGESIDIDDVTRRLNSMTQYRLLSAVVTMPGAIEPTPIWVQACTYHDFSLILFAEWAIDKRRPLHAESGDTAVKYFAEALQLWDGTGSRPALKARTVWALAAARLAAGLPVDPENRLADALEMVRRSRGPSHPETRLVRQLIENADEGRLSRSLVTDVLTYGWMHVEDDSCVASRAPKFNSRRRGTVL